MHSQSQPANAGPNPPPDLLTLLAIALPDPSLVAAFSQAFTLKTVQLGDRLLDSAFGEPADPLVAASPPETLSLVCQGRVRLVAYSRVTQKEVSVCVLEPGDTFGADGFFGQTPIAYSAIAASTGQLAQITVADLTEWLTQLPGLRDRLQQQAQHREQLLFWKTMTTLQALATPKLQALNADLTILQLPAGTDLTTATAASPGRFWLRHGILTPGQEQSLSLAVGESWGYPSPQPPNWIAQTDIVLYHLPPEPVAAIAAITPDCFPTSTPLSPLPSLSPVNPGRTFPDSPTINSTAPPGLSKTMSPPFQAAQATPLTALPAAEFPQPQWRSRQRFGQSYPFIAQQSAADCGLACLAMVGKYWGSRLNLSDLSQRVGVQPAGVSLQTLATTAESVGFQARPIRASLGRMVGQSQPWIAHWQGNHYVVVYRVKGHYFLVADPAVGRQKLSREEFQTHWTGYALLLDPVEPMAPESMTISSWQRFGRLLGRYRSLIAQIILASLLIQLFGLVTPLLTQFILDRVIVQQRLVTLNVFAIGLLMFGVWRIGFTAVRQYLLDYFANRLDLILVSGFMSHTLLLPLTFFTSRQVGDIVTRVQENQKVQLFLTRQAIVVWLDALMVFVYLGLMAYYNFQLMLLVLGILVTITLLVLGATPLMRHVSREIFRQAAAENSMLVEMLTGIETIKSAAVERILRWRWEDRLTDLLNARWRGQNLANTLQVISGLVNTLGSTALLWYGATLVIQGKLSVGQFVAFNMLFGSVLNPMLSLAQLWDELQEVVVATERLNDVFRVQPEEQPQTPMLVLPRIQGNVRFANVTFRYGLDQEENTLQTISFEVQPGQTIGIVGPSGSGKSTLINLLQGLYQPTSGRIFVDGHDIRHVSPQSLRSQIGVVPQECFLFSGTILENITLFRPEFSLEQVIAVARLAEAHSFIQNLPLGYQTKVGERGMTLSGGQRQRIAIARALLGEPQLLIFDEATSSLDAEAERRFRDNLRRIRGTCTVCMIAHRLSTIRDADHIFVLDRGILVEQGTHEELMALEGLYYHLAHQQL